MARNPVARFFRQLTGNCGNWQLEWSKINGIRQLPVAAPASAGIWNLSSKNSVLCVNFQMPANSPPTGGESALPCRALSPIPGGPRVSFGRGESPPDPAADGGGVSGRCPPPSSPPPCMRRRSWRPSLSRRNMHSSATAPAPIAVLGGRRDLVLTLFWGSDSFGRRGCLQPHNRWRD
jgi:hypothetical protein